MKSAIAVSIAAASLAFAVSVTAQDGETTAIPSDAAGALERPGKWNCSRIRPEYSRWLEQGNKPEAWRYAGKTFRDRATDKLYNWQDWLDWAEGAGCFAGNAPQGAGIPTNALIGGAVTVFGAGLIAVHHGSGPKSPG